MNQPEHGIGLAILLLLILAAGLVHAAAPGGDVPGTLAALLAALAAAIAGWIAGALRALRDLAERPPVRDEHEEGGI